MGTSQRIQDVIPHAHPILLLDRVLDVVPGEQITVIKAVTCNEPWYERVGDGATLADLAYPAALVLESWCQAAALLAAWDRPNPDVTAGNVMLGAGFAGVSFECDVYPGDVLTHRVTVRRAVDDAAILSGEATVDGKVVLRMDQFVMALRPISVLD